jgi:transglutaminase-like putative cysteine protease
MTEETNGVIRGTPERLPMSVFLRRTPSTTADAALRDKALDLRAAAHGDDLTTLHALMGWIAETIADEPNATSAAPSPAAILAATKGAARDRSHLFIAAARELDIPARFVTGYVFDPELPELMADAHAWAEGYVGGQLGWIGFDPTLDLCPTEAHVRVATGLDYLDAAPIRATSMGGGGETVTTKLNVREAKVRSRRPAMAE